MRKSTRIAHENIIHRWRNEAFKKQIFRISIKRKIFEEENKIKWIEEIFQIYLCKFTYVLKRQKSDVYELCDLARRSYK